MEVLYITMSVTVLLAGMFLFVFLRTVKKGQYEDTQTPAIRMLFDDELVKEKKQEDQSETKE